MNYLSLFSDLSLETIAKYTSDCYIFPILVYCSTHTAEQILFKNIITSLYQNGIYIGLHSSNSMIYYSTFENYIILASFKLYRDNKMLILMYNYVCNICKNQKIKLWKHIPEHCCARNIVIECICKK